MTLSWRSRKTGHERRGQLFLSWEVRGDPMSDDYTPDEAKAAELWRRWLERHGSPEPVPIWWGVQGTQTFERAPFQLHDSGGENFLTFFTWPEDTATGERINWLTLPVKDKLWRPAQADKGGFIQEFTGWKPSPLQPEMWPSILMRAMGR